VVVKKLLPIVAVFAVALALRLGGSHAVGPYDDAYHLKRIDSFPHLIQFDSDRDAWCPWPPGYDFVCGAIGAKRVVWLPPIAVAIFAAALAWRFGAVAGLGVALAPYLIGVSRAGDIDHHWVEPMLIAFIVVALLRRSVWMLAIAMTCALFVQTALIVACGLAFLALWLFDPERRYARAFLFAAAAVAIWRFSVPYPENPWFLGGAHIVLLIAAAVALALHGKWYALPVAVALTLPSLPELVAGAHFFRGDPWLASIVEFQPMFRDASRVGTDLANLGGGVLALLFALWGMRRRAAVVPLSTKIVLLFAVAYTLLALSSRRFLIEAIPLLCVIPSVARDLGGRAARTLAMTLAILLPPLAYDAYALAHPEPDENQLPLIIASEIRPLPPGRVLAPWYLGHAIDVFGHHAVVIDNFGSMPNATRFELANDALAQRHPEQLLAYCRRNDIRYLVMSRVRSWPGFVQVTPHVFAVSDTPVRDSIHAR
jgi:hypothetical protein